MSQVVVVVDGGPLSARAVAAVTEGAIVVAADGGLDHAVAAGLTPSVLVGDLDGISAAGRMWAYAHQVRTIEYPADKDATDTGLALAEAAAAAAAPEDTALLVVGGSGGDRLDHTLGTLTALGAPSLAGFASIRAVLGDTRVLVLHPGHSSTLDEPAGTTFSLLALHGPCSGVQVVAARWPLTDARLLPAATLGISNETVDSTVVGVVEGVLTVVIP